MHNQPASNRRDYFRIRDRVSLEIRQFEANTQDPAELFQIPAHYQLIKEFQLLETEAQPILSSIQDKDRNVAAYLKIINRKLDSLARTMALITNPIHPESLQEVGLSEGGISFISPVPLPLDSQLGIKIILLPSCAGLLIKGQVLDCSPSAKQHEVHVEFINLDDHQRQLIARHILRKQQEERRQSADL